MPWSKPFYLQKPNRELLTVYTYLNIKSTRGRVCMDEVFKIKLTLCCISGNHSPDERV
jgi:hypothetical protein